MEMEFQMDNIILIGMPGSGKSTIGVVLAKKKGFHFIDSDLLIQEREHMLLHEIISQKGLDFFNQVENEVNASIQTSRSVIATGGSVVYGKEAMMHLKSIGRVIYLKLSLEELEQRLGDLTSRGVSMRPGQTLAALFDERVPLYEKYADDVLDCTGLSIRECVEKISEDV
jgi:shikimate kinase